MILQLGQTPALIEITQRRWRCGHCKRSWARLSQAKVHVQRGCVVDPSTRACKTCTHRGGPGECAINALPYGQDWYDPWVKNCEVWEWKQ